MLRQSRQLVKAGTLPAAWAICRLPLSSALVRELKVRKSRRQDRGQPHGQIRTVCSTTWLGTSTTLILGILLYYPTPILPMLLY